MRFVDSIQTLRKRPAMPRGLPCLSSIVWAVSSARRGSTTVPIHADGEAVIIDGAPKLGLCGQLPVLILPGVG